MLGRISSGRGDPQLITITYLISFTHQHLAAGFAMSPATGKSLFESVAMWRDRTVADREDIDSFVQKHRQPSLPPDGCSNAMPCLEVRTNQPNKNPALNTKPCSTSAPPKIQYVPYLNISPPGTKAVATSNVRNPPLTSPPPLPSSHSHSVPSSSRSHNY